MKLETTANRTTNVVIGNRSNSPGTATKKVPMNTQAAATDMMIGALGNRLDKPMIGIPESMLERNRAPKITRLKRNVLDGTP